MGMFSMSIDQPQVARPDVAVLHTGGPQRGFTLVELLISLVLSSIIFVSAYQVISNLVQYQVRAADRQGDAMALWLLTNLFSQVVEKGAYQQNLPYRNSRSVVFRGRSDSLQIISRAYSDRFDLPGHRVYRMSARDGNLVINYRAYDREFDRNPNFEIDSGLQVNDLHFEYLGADDWIREWSDTRAFPKRIKLIATLGSGEEVEMVRSVGWR
jgi:prepilin-type N-terminal cleavage/methylation domain-containing protein